MIFNYGFSIVGKSHIAKGTCCQDAHMIKELDNGWIVAAVADGVGSAKNSQIGSSIAAKTVVEFCVEYMPWDYSVIGIKSMLRTAYNYAFKKIIEESENAGEPIESYDTTLTTVIYDGHRIIYGHSGDGGIIGLTVYGDYVQITKPQKGVDMISVLPLRSGYTVWSIDSYEEELAAVMIMTDGMLDYALCPYLLKLSNKSEVYTPIATYFADPYGVPNNEKKAKKVKESIKEFITADEDYDSDKFYIRLLDIYKKHLNDDADKTIEDLKEKNYPCAFMQSVQDDKTMVTLINPELQVDSKEKEFFIEPNWDDLQEEWNKKAYPHLYVNEDAQKNTNSETEPIETKDGLELETVDNEIDNKSTEEAVDKETLEHNDDESSSDSTNETPILDNSLTNNNEHKYQGKTKAFVDAKKQAATPSNPQVNTSSQVKSIDVDTIPVKHRKPKKENLLSRAADALADFLGFDDE